MVALSTRASLLSDALQIAVVLWFGEEDVVTLGLELSIHGLQGRVVAHQIVEFHVLAEAVHLG